MHMMAANSSGQAFVWLAQLGRARTHTQLGDKRAPHILGSLRRHFQHMVRGVWSERSAIFYFHMYIHISILYLWMKSRRVPEVLTTWFGSISRSVQNRSNISPLMHLELFGLSKSVDFGSSKSINFVWFHEIWIEICQRLFSITYDNWQCNNN